MTEQERVFAALPPARGRGFAQTWWGQTWLKALEDTALDGQQLRQGRTYARRGAVGAVSVRPGRITAVVLGGDRAPHRADVLLRELESDEWDRLLDMIADKAGHIAALLDRDMPPSLAEDAADAGLELLPGIGDLDPECACGAWDHCSHTAALSYQVARLLDEDPFVLLLARGRDERQVLDALQARSAARAAGPRHEPAAESPERPEGVDAQEAFALGAVLPPLPAPPLAVSDAARVAVLDGGEQAPQVDVAALELLAADAAARARRMLAEALSPGHEHRPPSPPLTQWQDAVRLASAQPDGPDGEVPARLARGCDRTRQDLRLAVRAWEFGGPAALDVLEDHRPPGSEALARARAQVETAWGDGETDSRLHASGNRWTLTGTGAQVRCGRDGRWWPYRKERGRWWPVGGPEPDPSAALAVALDSGTADSGHPDGEQR
ncbi:SWF or SNF family helicase [Streptomyces boncukensis]|uniref:SWF or SNF family helicase n=1 Tax=Streptomyces boncukensis TaxID=2711219 RepID=A0A6G4WVB3_9ACTN|nr:SWF or SNF family helicase [Streptomyces boncukensis]NGO68792.1 SWF or SNF family helicase [Streptomyces boncukensis]